MSFESEVKLDLSQPNKGLYESYYFRGVSFDKNEGFWLKHNLIKFNNDPYVRVDLTLVLFDRAKDYPSIFKDSTVLSDFEYTRSPFLKGKDWDDLHFEFESGSRFFIGKNQLCGQIESERGRAHWDFDLSRSNDVYRHFSKPWFYTGFFPKKKILTRDTRLIFEGIISAPNIEDKKRNSYIGINGHNWGSEHAYKYVYANCNQFDQGADAYFDGFSAQIQIGNLIKSPFLSSASLRIGGDYYYFNDVLTSFKPKVCSITDRHWKAKFSNDQHLLVVEIGKKGSKQPPWAALVYDHPSRAQSVVENTKFAEGVLTLKNKKSKKTSHELRSNCFELESLMPARAC